MYFSYIAPSTNSGVTKTDVRSSTCCPGVSICSAWQKFSKVSALVHALCTGTVERIFENLCLQIATLWAAPALQILKSALYSAFIS